VVGPGKVLCDHLAILQMVKGVGRKGSREHRTSKRQSLDLFLGLPSPELSTQ
jgi:hypothetical protein